MDFESAVAVPRALLISLTIHFSRACALKAEQERSYARNLLAICLI